MSKESGKLSAPKAKATVVPFPTKEELNRERDLIRARKAAQSIIDRANWLNW